MSSIYPDYGDSASKRQGRQRLSQTRRFYFSGDLRSLIDWVLANVDPTAARGIQADKDFATSVSTRSSIRDCTRHYRPVVLAALGIKRRRTNRSHSVADELSINVAAAPPTTADDADWLAPGTSKQSCVSGTARLSSSSSRGEKHARSGTPLL